MSEVGSHPFPSDEVLRTLLDIAPDSIAILRGETVLYMSPSGARLLGFERSSDVIGMSMAAWLSPVELELAMSRMGETIRVGRFRGIPHEYKVRNRNGKNFILEVSAVPITYGDGPAILAFVRDVTERRA